MLVEAEEHAAHDDELQDAHHLDDARLAEAIRQPSHQRRKENIGQHENRSQHVFQCAVGRTPQPDAQGDEQKLDSLFVEGVLSLYGHKRPEPHPLFPSRFLIELICLVGHRYSPDIISQFPQDASLKG